MCDRGAAECVAECVAECLTKYVAECGKICDRVRDRACTFLIHLYTALCRTVLCRAVLCRAVLCCAVLCRAVFTRGLPLSPIVPAIAIAIVVPITPSDDEDEDDRDGSNAPSSCIRSGSDIVVVGSSKADPRPQHSVHCTRMHMCLSRFSLFQRSPAQEFVWIQAPPTRSDSSSPCI